MKKKKTDFSDPFGSDLANFTKTVQSLRSESKAFPSPAGVSSTTAHQNNFSSLDGQSIAGGNPFNVSLGGVPIGRRGRQLQSELTAGEVSSGERVMGDHQPSRRQGSTAPPYSTTSAPVSASSFTPHDRSNTSPLFSPSAQFNSFGIIPQGRRGEERRREPRVEGGTTSHSPFSTPSGFMSSSFPPTFSGDTSVAPGADSGQAQQFLRGIPAQSPPKSSSSSRNLSAPELSDDLPWLSDVPHSISTEASSPAAGRSPSGPDGAERRLFIPPPAAAVLPASYQVLDDTSAPSFLQDDDEKNDRSATQIFRPNAPEEQLPPQALPSAVESTSAISSWILKQTKLEEEKKELYSELEGLELEIEMIDRKMSLQQIKDETELLQLDTELLTCRAMVSCEEEKAADKRKETEELEREITEMEPIRRAREWKELQEEVLSGERSRYELRMKHLLKQLEDVSGSVALLQNQQELLRFSHPYDKRSVLAVISSSSKGPSETPSTFSSPGTGSQESKSRNEEENAKLNSEKYLLPEGEQSERTEARQRVQWHIDKALEIIKNYCNEHCQSLRKGIIDVIHRETERAAHEVRQARESSWIYEAMQRKEQMAAYKSQSLEEYLAFFRRRGAATAKNSRNIHEIIKSQHEQLRNATRERLSQAEHRVEAQIKYQEESNGKKVQESFLLQKERLGRNEKMDSEWRQAKLEELRTQCHTKLVVKKKLLLAEREVLKEQCMSTSRSVTKERCSNFSALQEESKMSVRKNICNAQELLDELKHHIESQFLWRKGYKELKTSSSCKSVASKAKVEELRVLLEEAQQVTVEELNQCQVKTKRVEELFLKATSLLSCILELLSEKRRRQQSQQQEISLQRTRWEREHQKALAAPQQAEVFSTIGAARGAPQNQNALTSTPLVYTDPTRVMIASYLSELVNRLQSFFKGQNELRQERDKQRQSPNGLIHCMRQHHSRVNQAWATVLEAVLRVQDLSAEKTKHDAQMIIQQERLAQEKNALNVEQDVLENERKSLEASSSTKVIVKELSRMGL